MSKTPVKIVPNGDRWSYELSDRSARIGIFTTREDAEIGARLAGYEVANDE